jgi:hypothetical protein
MADAKGMRYEFQGVRFADRHGLHAALATHLGLDAMPTYGHHGGVIVVTDGAGGWVQKFTYEHTDGVDVITPV